MALVWWRRRGEGDWQTSVYCQPFWLDLAAATTIEAEAEHWAANTPNPENPSPKSDPNPAH